MQKEKEVQMEPKRKMDDAAGILFFLLSAGMLCASCLFLCTGSDIWYDEVFTLGLANQPLGELISITAGDVHPPLYYMIVKLFLAFGTDSGIGTQVALAKLASCGFFGLCIVLAAVKIRRNFGLLAAGLFAFLLVSMPQLSGYMVEMRMYGLSVFFLTAGMSIAYELTSQERDAGKNWIFLTLCSLAACYTHYFACVAACMIYVYLLVCFGMQGRLLKKLGKYLISGFVCAAGYLPWLAGVVSNQLGKVKENYWIQPVSLRTLGGCVKFLFFPSLFGEKGNAVWAVVFFGIYLLVFGAAFVRYRRERGKREKEILVFFTGRCAVLAGIVLFGMGASIAVKPVFVYRYMLPAMGVFWLAFAVLAAGLNGWKLKVFLLGFVLITGLGNFRSFYGEETWKSLQMQAALSELSQIGEGDIVIFNFDQAQAVTGCYLPNDTYLWYGKPEELVVRMYPQNKSLVEGEFSDEAGMEAIKKFLKSGERVWFLGTGNAREEIRQKWEKEGIHTQEKASVMIERYWINFYLLSCE